MVRLCSVVVGHKTHSVDNQSSSSTTDWQDRASWVQSVPKSKVEEAFKVP